MTRPPQWQVRVSAEVAEVVEAADRAGVSFSLSRDFRHAMARLARNGGQQNPSVGMLMRIAKATDTDLVIEFRRKARKRRAARVGRGSLAAGKAAAGREPVAASHSED